MEVQKGPDLEKVSLRSVGKPVLVLSDKSTLKVRHGILRFFGTVEFASGLFCGIELDSPHGKHNGSYKGIRYFQCAPDHGIFVAAEKVYADTKSRIKSNISVPGSIIQKGKLKRAQSDVYTSIGTTSTRGNNDLKSTPGLIPPDSSLFDILSTFSTEISSSKEEKSCLSNSKSNSLIASKPINFKYTTPSNSSTFPPSPKTCDSSPRRQIASRPSSVTNQSNKHSSTVRSSNISKNDFSTLIRHSSLTEIRDIHTTTQFKNGSESVQQLVTSETQTFNTRNGFKNGNFVTTRESISDPVRAPDNIVQQQTILSTAIIPDIPSQYDFSFQITSLIDSIHKNIKDPDYSREILQCIEMDNCIWDNKTQILQEQFRKLKDDVEILCYRHLEVLSSIPSQD